MITLPALGWLARGRTRAAQLLAFVLAAAGTAPLATAQTMPPGDTLRLTLGEAIAIAGEKGLAAEAARSSIEASRLRGRAFGARLLPQLRFESQPISLDRNITPVIQPDGSTELLRVRSNVSTYGVTVAQPLPWTGTELTLSSGVTRYDILGSNDINQRTYKSSPLVLGIRQPLFQPRARLWDQRTQDVAEELAERQYLEAREDIASAAAGAFFDLHAATVAVANAAANAAVNDTLYTLNTGRYEVGKIGENDLLQSELAVLRARTALDGARLDRARAEATLQRLLRITPARPIAVVVPDDVPTVRADPEAAVREALANASVTEQSRFDDVVAKRRIAETRYRNGFGATVDAQVGVNQTASIFSDVYQSPLPSRHLTLGVTVPLVQWGAGRAEVQAARADEARVTTLAGARREALAEEARFAALEVPQTARVLAISAKADTVATRRFDVAKNRYVIGKIGIGELYIAQSEKDQALLAYVNALRAYWISYYRLRRVTLYDFAADRRLTP